jgi:hypothetical protein
MLGQHPEAYGMPELNLFLTDTLEGLQKKLVDVRHFQLHGLLRTVAQLYSGEQTLDSIEMARRWLTVRSDWTTGAIYIELCRKVAPLRPVDKSPAYSTDLEVLQRLYNAFPKAAFIHLVRHPRTMAQSLLNIKAGQAMAMANNSLDYSTDPPTIDPQFMWYNMQRIICTFLDQVPAEQQRLVQGEKLLANTQLYFQTLCQWLGLSWSEAAFEAMKHPEQSPYACYGPFGANLGNDPNFLKSPYFKESTSVKTSTLEGSLPWRPDGKGFLPHVIEMAQKLGYH